MKTNKKLMAIVTLILISAAIFLNAQRNHTLKSTFYDLATQNIKALAEDTTKHPCPSPYDVWEAVVICDPKVIGNIFNIMPK